jgi:alpha-L-fucosidase
MKHYLSLFFALLLTSSTALKAQEQQAMRLGSETPEEKEQRMAWWKQDRFGMFIHFGLYAMPARHEWVKTLEKIPEEHYDKYFQHFNPENYDAKEWAKQAKEAGMKYVVMTTKHHEGFCLFDSKYTDYKSTNTPFGRDLIREYVDAFRAEGIKVGFYYSIIDWHHPHYPVEAIHPLRPGNFPLYQPFSLALSWRKSKRNDRRYAELNKERNMAIYREYMFNQVRELLTNYGEIDVMWFDFSTKKMEGVDGIRSYYGKSQEDYHAEELQKLVRELQPGIIINNRLDLHIYEDGEDFVTPEQVSTKELKAYRGKNWETCQTFSGSWGYHRGQDKKWKTEKELISLLITSVANGGNLLLNVGPTALGEFDYRANNALQRIGHWMRYHSKSIYGCTVAPDQYRAPKGTLLTWNAQTGQLYLHLLKQKKSYRLKNMARKLLYAELMHDRSEVQMYVRGNDIVLKLKRKHINSTVPVVELHLK